MKFRFLLFVLLYTIQTFSSFAQELKRQDVEEKYKWNLADMFKSVSGWQSEKQILDKKIDEYAKYKGHLSDDHETFYLAVKDYFDILKSLYLVSNYVYVLSDEDVRISANQALKQESASIATKFSENTAFLNPEILDIGADKINEFFKMKPELSEFKMFVDDILRLKEHTLSTSEEKILASAGLVTGTPNDVYSIFNNAEMPNAEVTLPEEGTLKLTSSSFTKYRTLENRESRKKVFEAFFNNYGKFKNTLGVNFGGKMQGDFFYAKNRNFTSTLELALSGPNIPVSVYENLVKQINDNLPTLHRFLKLKKKMLGLDTLHYYDLYTPIVKQVDMQFTIEEGQNIILESLMPMGSDYNSILKKSFTDRWIDYYPTEGKRSGAYVSGAAYDVHPYMLLNWNDNYESVTTFAHEIGHAMHSYYSNKNQTFANSDYETFVAEIASTLNENLLNDYMVQNAKSNEEKIYLLGNYLELLRTTIFRQTSFAEFEWETHKMAENNQPITGEALSELYYKIVSKYYGNDANTCIVDPYIAYEWAYIPHFLGYMYYVYQYSTSLIYATAFAEKILKEGQPAVDKYFYILNGGASEYPIDLIKKAGIDALSPEAFNLTMNKMNKVMDQIEELLAKR